MSEKDDILDKAKLITEEELEVGNVRFELKTFQEVRAKKGLSASLLINT